MAKYRDPKARIIVRDRENGSEWAIETLNADHPHLAPRATKWADSDDVELVGIELNGAIYTPDQVLRLQSGDFGFTCGDES